MVLQISSPDVQLNEIAAFCSVSCMSGYQCLLGKGGVNWFLECSVGILLSIRASIQSDNIWELKWEGKTFSRKMEEKETGNARECLYLNCTVICGCAETIQQIGGEGSEEQLRQAQPGSWVCRRLEKEDISLMSLHRLRSDMFV